MQTSQPVDNLIYTRRYASPAGVLIVGCHNDTIVLCDWADRSRRDAIDSRICRALGARYIDGTTPLIEKTIKELDEYFAEKRTEFSVPVTLIGTPFQRTVWAELLKIAYGTTLSYSAVARSIGKPKAIRAVASAIGANPLSIIVPCHRVVGADNSLTGYAGGLPAKRHLLHLEHRHSPTTLA